MKVHELIDNNEFSFNVRFMICEYVPAKIGSNEEGHTILKFDSDIDKIIDPILLNQDITAINQIKDGTVEIEYIGEDLF